MKKVLCALIVLIIFLIPTISTAQTEIIFRPGPGLNDGTDNGSLNGGKDTYVNGSDPSTGNGSNIYFGGSPISNCNPAMVRGYIQFDLSALPATVEQVFLGVTHEPHNSYCYSNCEADFYFYPVTEAWNETTLTYTTMPAEGPAVYGPINITFPNDFGNREYDITDIYRNWKNNTVPNYGLAIYSPTVGCNNASVSWTVDSSDHTEESRRPYLRIISTAGTTASDDFDDNSKDMTKWGTDEVKGSGQLNEVNGRLEYTCGGGSGISSSDRPWKLRRFPSDADWSIEITATNTTSPASDKQWSSFGINIESMRDRNDSIEVELAASSMVWAELHNNGQYVDGIGSAGSTSLPIRISYTSATKIFTVSYFDGSVWVDFGTFGVNGSGGLNGNANWALAASDQFIAYVFGYSEKMAVGNGQLYGDNFQETGGTEIPLPEITNPSDGANFDTCSYFVPPLFEWTLPNAFQKLELQFYTPANPAKPLKVRVKDPAATQLQMPANTWKKILKFPGLSGGEINFKIVGTIKGEPAVESNVYTMTITPPEPVENPQISKPASQSSEPTLSWGNACATKFKVHFSPDMPEAKEKKLTFADQNPVDDEEIFTVTLTEGKWNAIRKLVNDVIGSRMCFYVESWDIVKRYQKTDWVCFDLEP